MMKASQKIRATVNGISFFSTAKLCREGVGSSKDTNCAVYLAYWSLEDARKSVTGRGVTNGISGKWNEYRVQLDVVAKA